MLGELHALASLYKGYVTTTTTESIEICRRSCGGHGYSMNSGIPSIYAMYIAACTYDGDNDILILQAAKHICALIRNFGKGKPIPAKFLFLASCIPNISGDNQNPACPEFHQKCFQAIAHFRFHRLVVREASLIKNGIKKEKIWTDDLQIEGIEASQAVYHGSVHEDFVAAIFKIQDIKIKEAIENLRQIYAISELEKFHGTLLRVGISGEILDKMKEVLISALDKVRNDAIGLIEAFEVPDETLCSVIGRKDGKIYPAMIDAAKHLNPINKHKVFPGIHKYIRPRL